MDKHPVTPAPIVPARELLGELLVELNQPKDALVEFEGTLMAEPNRVRSLFGAAQAAELSGDTGKARALYTKVVSLCDRADTERAALKQARAFLSRLSLAKTSSDSLRSTEMLNPSAGPRPRAWLEVGRPASLDRQPCTVTLESRCRTGSGRAGRLSWTCDACSMVVRTAGARLRRLADVAVMQATDFENLHDPTRRGELDGPDVRRILVEREMRARPVIVGAVSRQGAAQVPFAEDEDVIQTLASDRADEPLREGILPRAVRRGEDFTDAMPFTRCRNTWP